MKAARRKTKRARIVEAFGAGSDDLALAAEVANAKPRDALANLRVAVAAGGAGAWRTKARRAAVLGNCPKSHSSLASGRSACFISSARAQIWCCLIARPESLVRVR